MIGSRIHEHKISLLTTRFPVSNTLSSYLINRRARGGEEEGEGGVRGRGGLEDKDYENKEKDNNKINNNNPLSTS